MKTKPTYPGSLSVARKYREPGADASALARPLIPVQTSFRHLPASEAVAARITGEVQKLRRYFDGISYCHVVVVAPHRHRRTGRRYSIHIELDVPRERLAITHEPPARTARDEVARAKKSDEWDAAHKDVQVAVREAFTAARRQLQEYVRRLRGEVKTHRNLPRPRAEKAPAAA